MLKGKPIGPDPKKSFKESSWSARVQGCSSFLFFHYFFLYIFSNSVRMEVMLWFEDSGESTSTLPFLTNSKVGMAGFVNLHKMAPIKNSFSHLQSAQNGGKSAYFHLVQELHIAMHYLYNHSMHGLSKKQKPPISCAYAHSLCVLEVKKTYIKKKNNKTLNSKFFRSLSLGTQVCFT